MSSTTTRSASARPASTNVHQMTHPLRFGLKLSGQDTTVEALRAVWRLADDSGFDHVWDFDHLASIGEGGPDRPIFEGWTLQAAMAQATRRARIGCLVTGNTYRHPVLLAKQAVTVDHLSGGRLEFGIGAAWAEIEHSMYGIEGLDHRVGRLRESLQIIKSLWTQERTDFEGRYYHLKDAIANPKPIQKPHPPIWIGASGPNTLRLVASHADVWNAAGGGDSKKMKETIAMLEESARYLELGFTEQVIYLRGSDAATLAGKVADLLPELRRLGRTPA